jgi:hypothetical protein
MLWKTRKEKHAERMRECYRSGLKKTLSTEAERNKEERIRNWERQWSWYIKRSEIKRRDSNGTLVFAKGLLK